LRGVCATITAVENKYFICQVCVCNLSYRACNMNAPYCLLWLVRLYNIFRPYLINGTIFGKKKLLNVKCVFWFSLQCLSEIFLILIKNWTICFSPLVCFLPLVHIYSSFVLTRDQNCTFYEDRLNIKLSIY